MKRFFHAMLVLPLALFAAACSDNDGDEAVKLESGTDTKQQVFADDTAPAPIRFTATAAWTATVADTTPVRTKTEAGRIDWLVLSAYEGSAGDVSLTMTLLPNYTGTDRKAEIRIACGGTTIKITVEQKGTKADGTLPDEAKPDDPNEPGPTNMALVARIDVEFNGWSELPDYERINDLNLYLDPSNMYFAFRYDDRKRIVEYEKAVYSAYEPEIKVRSVYKFDYSVEGEIRMVDTGSELTEPVVPFRIDSVNFTTHTIRLDAQNRAVCFISGNEYAQPNYFYTYNDEGRLSRWKLPIIIVTTKRTRAKNMKSMNGSNWPIGTGSYPTALIIVDITENIRRPFRKVHSASIRTTESASTPITCMPAIPIMFSMSPLEPKTDARSLFCV